MVERNLVRSPLLVLACGAASQAEGRRFEPGRPLGSTMRRRQFAATCLRRVDVVRDAWIGSEERREGYDACPRAARERM